MENARSTDALSPPALARLLGDNPEPRTSRQAPPSPQRLARLYSRAYRFIPYRHHEQPMVRVPALSEAVGGGHGRAVGGGGARSLVTVAGRNAPPCKYGARPKRAGARCRRAGGRAAGAGGGAAGAATAAAIETVAVETVTCQRGATRSGRRRGSRYQNSPPNSR